MPLSDNEEEMLRRLSGAVKDADEEGGRALALAAMAKGIDPLLMIEKALTPALREVGEKFSSGEAFLLDMMASAKVVEVVTEILVPEIEKSGRKQSLYGRMVIGTVQGDIHDIGKNIVAMMLRASGFEVIDIGKDVPIERFIETVKKIGPNIVGASALLTSTMIYQRELVKALEKEGLRDGVKVIIGGAPCTAKWAHEIGADGYAANASEAVDVAMKLVGKNEGFK